MAEVITTIMNAMVLFIFFGFLSSLSNVKEHATLSAGARVDHGVGVETTDEHENRAADRGCCASACSPSIDIRPGKSVSACEPTSQHLGSVENYAPVRADRSESGIYWIERQHNRSHPDYPCKDG